MAAKEGPPPPGIAELGDDVWRGDKPSAQRGIVVLGTPVGHADFVQAWTDARLQEERRLLDELPHLPDLLPVRLVAAAVLCIATRQPRLANTPTF